MSAAWTKLEGHAINGVLPLRRCIASSDHSGIFSTDSAGHSPSTVVLKLVRIDPTSADVQLSRWLAATALSHPHLIRIFEAGQCHVDGLDCLYVLMEYADENLAQILKRRALTEEEAREMLGPMLSALAYLHERGLLQGQLKPSNILAVAGKLKLASDTVRAVGTSARRMNTGSAHDPPEERDRIYSAAGDIWALGVTLREALAPPPLSGPYGRTGSAELPPELYPPIREIVARCLRRNPGERPEVADLQAWLRREVTTDAAAAPTPIAATALPPTTMSPSADPPVPAEPSVARTAIAEESKQADSVAATKPKPDSASTFRLVIRAEIIPEEPPQPPAWQHLNRRTLALVLGSITVVALIWLGIAVFRTDPTSNPAVSYAARDVESPSPTTVPTRDEAPSNDEPSPKPTSAPAEAGPTNATPTVPQARLEPEASPSPAHEVIPKVPQSALQTIRGTIRVSIRVTVDKSGAVIAATPHDPGPSRYFQKLAIDASKQWKFAPDVNERRTLLVRFNFTRQGTTARSSPVQ